MTEDAKKDKKRYFADTLYAVIDKDVDSEDYDVPNILFFVTGNNIKKMLQEGKIEEGSILGVYTFSAMKEVKVDVSLDNV